jgi:tight adherence protein C
LTYLFSVSIFILILLSVLFIVQALNTNKSKIRSRLNFIGDMLLTGEDDQPLNLPFKVRIVKPMETKLVGYFSSLLPANLKSLVDKKLVQCGNPRGLKASVFMSWVIAAAIAVIMLWVFGSLFLGYGFINAVIGVLVILLLAIIVPALWLQMTAAKRIKVIEMSLPDVIDLLVISVEAGLGFDMALSKVIEKIKGPLSEEFAKALNEIKMGKTRQAALKDLSARVGSENLHSFLTMIIQSTIMGFAIGPVLRIQSDTMRVARRQQAEEMAMKAPIKMVFPLVFCIFPALFIVLLGPALIKILESGF